MSLSRFARVVVVALFGCFVSLAGAADPSLSAAQCECTAENTLVIGHRGDGAGVSENTVASAEAAFLAGADMIEIDVQQSADGVVVLMHDDTVDRTTEGSGCVSALSAAQLDALGVPTLSAFLAAVSGALDVEVKLHETDACPAQDLEALADAVATDLAADPVTDRRVLVTSFDRPLLQRLRMTAPSLDLGLLGGNADLIDAAETDGFAAAVLLSAVVNARTVRRARDAGVGLYVWTVNDQANIEAVLPLGIDGVITDTVPAGVAARTAVCADWMCESDAGPGGALDAGAGTTSDGGCAVSHGRRAPVSAMVLLAAVSLWTRRRRSAP